jgi:hypothetical protein
MKWYVILLALFLLSTKLAYAQDIRRCVKSDGSITFTDKSCEEDEIEKQKIQKNTTTNFGAKRGYSAPPSCNKTTKDLLYSVRTAIDMQDANLLAKNYHWTGVSNQQAEKIFDRLEKIVTNSLVDIRLLQASNTPNSDIPSDSNLDLKQNSPNYLPSSSYALKIVQQNKSTSTQQLSTVFNLQKNYGCYWIRY